MQPSPARLLDAPRGASRLAAIRAVYPPLSRAERRRLCKLWPPLGYYGRHVAYLARHLRSVTRLRGPGSRAGVGR